MKHTIKLTPKPVTPEARASFGDCGDQQIAASPETTFASMQRAAAGDDYVAVPPCFPSGVRNAGSPFPSGVRNAGSPK